MVRRRARIPTSDSDEDEAITAQSKPPKKQKLALEELEEEEEEEEEPEEETGDAKPIGETVKVTGKGRKIKHHYKAFSFDDHDYELEDPVLLSPEDADSEKPYVAIIKDIIQDNEGNLEIMGQWFYRPEEATDKGGGCWKGLDTRELFYSFHRDVVSAESIMHKCVVHFVPLNKQFPLRKEHPGFIVQRVYDTVERKLWKLTDKDYEDSKQHEIDLLVQKTRERIGELPDVVPEDTCADQEGQVKGKQRSNLSPLNVTREDDRVRRTELDITAGTPGSCTSGASEYYKVLANFNALTKDDIRDKWMEKLLQGLHSVCDDKNIQLDGKDKDESNRSDGDKFRERGGPKDGGATSWPDAAVAAVVALEKASHDLFISEFKKYNNKMRQLYFNLKEGLTANEIEKNEPEASEHMQMTDKRCSGCGEKKVVVTDVIQGREDRYKLECTACGSSWYASRDEISTLTIEDTSRAIGNVGTAPLATAKFEDVEKKLVSPKESEKPDADIFQKTTKSQMPVLETQKSFLKRPKPE